MEANKIKYHIFGKCGEWAISEDDGCLRFHPQWNTNSEKTSSWIWKEAWEEVEKLGGYDKVVEMLKGKNEINERTS